MAVVFTHNAPDSLARCLEAIADQTTPPEAVLVVDNASSPPVARWTCRTGRRRCEMVRSEVNTGPAGGYARGWPSSSLGIPGTPGCSTTT